MDDPTKPRDPSPSQPSHAIGLTELMRRDFITVTPEATLDEARQLMRLARLRHLAVVHQGCLVGLLSYRSLLESLLADRRDRSEARAHPSVATLMVTEPECTTSQCSVDDVAAQLLRLGIGCLPVVDAEGDPPQLIGLVTECDLLRAAYDPWFRGHR